MNEQLDCLVAQLREIEARDGASRLRRIELLEQLKGAVAAAQAAETAEFATWQRAERVTAGISPRDAGAGIAAEVALVRRVSPHQAQRYVGWSSILVEELPDTFEALRRGETTEWRAMVIARETACLPRTLRAVADRELARRLPGLGDRQVEVAAKRAVYRLDPQGALDRSRNAATDRRVSLRPAPDTMCRLTALLPVAQGVAAYAALAHEADSCIATGDEARDGRGRGQVMADTLVERLTGQARADQVPVEVGLVMTDSAMLDGGNEPAVLVGHGPIPAALAREWVGDAPAWLRRLYRAPRGDQLAVMDTHRRAFTENQRRFVRFRDQGVCRTPYCGAPVRHVDHVRPVEHGGRTSVDNAQGLCAACNYAKQSPGWHARVLDTQVVITTANRHRIRHRPPDPPAPERSPLEKDVVRGLSVA